MKKPNFPKSFTNKFAKKLLTYFGHTNFSDWDNFWCWDNIIPKFVQYKDKFLEFLFLFNKTHDICLPLFWLCKYKVIDKSIIESVIEKNNNCYYAYLMVLDCNSDRSWAEKIIEKNNDCYYLYCMVRDCNSDRSWAEKIIEKTNNSYFVYLMALDCNSDRLWAEKIIENNNDSEYAYRMVKNFGSSQEWYKSIKRKKLNEKT